jgi:hypothetical protein
MRFARAMCPAVAILFACSSGPAHAQHPLAGAALVAAEKAADYLFGKAVDYLWDRATGTVRDYEALEGRIRELEQLHPAIAKDLETLRRMTQRGITRYECELKFSVVVGEVASIRGDLARFKAQVGERFEELIQRIEALERALRIMESGQRSASPVGGLWTDGMLYVEFHSNRTYYMYDKYSYENDLQPRVVQQGVWEQTGNEIALKKTGDDRKGARWLIDGDVMEKHGFPAKYVRVRRGGASSGGASSGGASSTPAASPVGGRWENPDEIIEFQADNRYVTYIRRLIDPYRPMSLNVASAGTWRQSGDRIYMKKAGSDNELELVINGQVLSWPAGRVNFNRR